MAVSFQKIYGFHGLRHVIKVRCHACAQTDARTCERRAVFCLDRIRNICFADFSENLQHENRVQRVPRARWHAVVMGGPWTQGHLRLSTLNRLLNVDRQSGFRSKGHLLSVVQSNNNLLYNMYSIRFQIFKYCHAMSTNIEIFTHPTGPQQLLQTTTT